MQECFAGLGYKTGDFPEAETAASNSLAIPVYQDLTEAQIKFVVDNIKEFITLS